MLINAGVQFPGGVGMSDGSGDSIYDIASHVKYIVTINSLR